MKFHNNKRGCPHCGETLCVKRYGWLLCFNCDQKYRSPGGDYVKVAHSDHPQLKEITKWSVLVDERTAVTRDSGGANYFAVSGKIG